MTQDAATTAEQTIGGYLEVLGSDSPTPGGGAVAGVVAAAAGALIAMVGRLTVGKDEFVGVADRMQVLVAEGDAARAAFLDLADRDAHAFDGVMAAFKMPKQIHVVDSLPRNAMGKVQKNLLRQQFES